MKNLSSPNVPVVSKKIRIKMALGVVIGGLLAYSLLLVVAVIANKILE